MDREVAVAAVSYIVLGGVTSLTIKWGDGMVIAGTIDDGAPHPWVHPYCQAWVKFFAQTMCLVAAAVAARVEARALARRRVSFTVADDIAEKEAGDVTDASGAAESQPWRYFAGLAAMDTVRSVMKFVGLQLTSVSVYQMLLGSNVLFTGLLSRLFLGKRFKNHQIIGIATVVAGLTCVGAASATNHEDEEESRAAAVGCVLVLLSQVLAAAQVVFEEHVFRRFKSTTPTQLVGWEGFFGTVFLSCAIAAFQLLQPPPDDAADWAVQAGNSWQAQVSLLMLSVSIPVSNAGGQTITKRVSATSNSFAKAMQVVFVWVVDLLVFGSAFLWLQLIGFVALMVGTAVYKKLLPIPAACREAAETDPCEARPPELPSMSPVPSCLYLDEEDDDGVVALSPSDVVEKRKARPIFPSSPVIACAAAVAPAKGMLTESPRHRDALASLPQ
jgi:drug/metabolite transporter (DMT)-like permease